MHPLKCTDSIGIPSTNIFVNYLPQEFTKKELVQLFNPFGQIQSAKVIINLTTGISKCYGFVRFASIYSAQQAILALNGMSFPQYNKTLLVKFAGSKMENTGEMTNSIYVKSLCLHFSIKDIWCIFSKFGKIRGIDAITDQKTKLFNGTAIITFSSTQEAQEAVRVMNNIKLTSESWPLFIQYTEKQAENQILNSDTESFLNGIKIVKPKNKKAFDHNKNRNNNSLNSNIDAYNQYSQGYVEAQMKNKVKSCVYNNISSDEECKSNKNEKTYTYEEQNNFMFSIIAEEL